ncbi:MAG: D-2-hydroxyacid dehydrogenase [Pseudomonadota bacterium]
MGEKPVMVVHGAATMDDVPGLEAYQAWLEIRFATDESTLGEALVGAEILLEWNFAADDLQRVWSSVDSLRWIHWSGAGVDAALFPGLVESDIRLTNARGIFDRAMGEYVLGLILAFAKRFPETWSLQSERQWRHRLTERIDGRVVTVVGMGGIARSIARLVKAVGMRVYGVGRRERGQDLDFDRTLSVNNLNQVLGETDYLVLVLPATAETQGLIGADELRALKSSARVINVGRGNSLDEAALIAALGEQHIAGAALDVFHEEPLPSEHVFWSLDNVIVSPHMSGDFYGYAPAVAEAFFDNLIRYRAGEPLLNEINKLAGYYVG